MKDYTMDDMIKIEEKINLGWKYSNKKAWKGWKRGLDTIDTNVVDESKSKDKSKKEDKKQPKKEKDTRQEDKKKKKK